MKESRDLRQAVQESDRGAPIRPLRFHRESEVEPKQARCDLIEQPVVLVDDPEATAVATFSIEHAGEETLAPIFRGILRPLEFSLNSLNVSAAVVTDGLHLAV